MAAISAATGSGAAHDSAAPKEVLFSEIQDRLRDECHKVSGEAVRPYDYEPRQT